MKSLIITMLVFSIGISQKKPQASPRATVSQVIGLTKVTVDYGRPAVKERTVYGELVKYDKVWRTGANEQSEIEFSGDVTLNGNKVMKGRYAFFTIPKANGKWTIILNKTLGQWGAFSYKEDADLLRFEVDVTDTMHHERLSFYFDNFELTSGDLIFAWGKKSFKIRISE